MLQFLMLMCLGKMFFQQYFFTRKFLSISHLRHCVVPQMTILTANVENEKKLILEFD